MLPEQPISYPEFVADQLLTAANLNDLFEYLDEQERGTRVNLIGIGIVCGLELLINDEGTEITITKGCGITTEGYLVRWDQKSFQNYKAYDAAREIVYEPFYSGGAQRFPIDELKADSSEEGLTKLSKEYLADKVALIFVELLREDAKNCNPESCDDKGRDVTLSLIPLLVNRKDAKLLSSGLAGASVNQGWLRMPAMKMPRHHVPADDIFDSGDVLQGFLETLGPTFLKQLETNLSTCYSRLAPLLLGRFPSNPFAGLAGDFAFLTNGTITVSQLLYLQYYYDLFSDVIAAYEELRKKGMKLLSLCCPDENLFPRHLLLGLTGKGSVLASGEMRQAFIPSPANCCHSSLVAELRFLFQRLVLLLQRFEVPGSNLASLGKLNAAGRLNAAIVRAPIRITPSRLGDDALSEKAIPYYYNVIGGTEALFQYWSYARTMAHAADQNLSYHAALYNQQDDEVRHPLKYDLEPYNFLRIEGHVGHSYTEALDTINQIRDANRLPFDVVALSADVITLREQLASIAAGTSKAALRENVPGEFALNCHFQDLEALYDTMAQGLICTLCKEMKYYYEFPPRKADETPTLQVPGVPLLRSCDPDYRYRPNTLGASFEAFYKTLPAQYIQPEQFLSGNAVAGAFTGFKAAVATNNNNIPGFALLYYIEKLSEVLPTSLSGFSIAAFVDRYTDLMTVAQKLKDAYLAAGVGAATGDNELGLAIVEDVVDHLDALLFACRMAPFIALYNDYKLRWIYLSMLRKFGYYSKLHPGFQHKAGVNMGGTFILVYHERSKPKVSTPNIFVAGTARTKSAVVGKVVEEVSEEKKATFSKSTLGQKTRVEAAESAVGAEKKSEFIKDTDASTIRAKDAIRRISVSKLRTMLSAKQMGIIDKLFFKDLITRHSLDELTAQLPDKVVIADFFLPYMCCSDCPPVYYVVTETKEEEKPAISIKTTEFCSSDQAVYPVTVSPAGGTLSGEGTSVDNGAMNFHPAAVNIPAGTLNKVVTLSYTVGDQVATTSVTVFAKPVAAFEIKRGTSYNVVVLDSTSQNAASIAWTFSDGGTDSGDLVTHFFKEDGTYTITLAVTNGACTATASQDVTIVKAEVSVEGKLFCSGDGKTYPITVSPTGGIVSGEGVKTDTATGTATFSPSQVAFEKTQASKNVAISYTVQGQTVQTIVTVSQLPSAAFTVNTPVTAGPTVRLFSTDNAFTATYRWDFGDGSQSDVANPSHDFKKPGSYNVRLTVSNGTACEASSSQQVVIEDKPTQTKNCGPLSGIIELFNAFVKQDPARLKSFTTALGDFGEISDYFTELKGISGKPVTDQIKFFSDSQVGARLQSWFERLQSLIMEGVDREFGLMLWRILTQLAMYVMCIQSGDFDKNAVNLANLFADLAVKMKSWAQFVPKLTAVEKAQMQLLLNDLKAEVARLDANGETAVKPTYVKALNTLIKLLTGYLK